MNIAISNIAWNKEEDWEIAKILQKHKISGIEIAPTKIWNNPTTQLPNSIIDYKNYWIKKGINIVALQSLLFGHPELSIFENSQIRKGTLSYLSKIIKVGSLLGAKVMIFGSPKNRRINNLNKEEAFKIACEFFYNVGEISKQYQIYFCIEPNPAAYEADFILNTDEGVALVKAVNHPNFRLHLDSSTLILNKENYENSIRKAFGYLSHFHISEPYLRHVNKNTNIDHQTIAKTLKNLNYNKWISVEMRGNDNKPNIPSVDETLKFVTGIYR